MIVTVKKNKNKKIKIISFVLLVLMFVAYYFYMKDEYEIPMQKEIKIVKVDSIKNKRKILAKKLEKIIYKEIESSIDLIGQEYIKDVQVLNNKVLITCDVNTDISAVTIRYGSIALIKKSIDNIKIAIDIKYIVDSKLEESMLKKKSKKLKNNEK